MPPSKAQIIRQLDQYLETEFTFIHTEQLVEHLLPLPTQQQNFILAWVKSLASTQIELAHQFMIQATELIKQVDEQRISEWATHILDTYDKSGLYPAMTVVQHPGDYVHQKHKAGCFYRDVQGILHNFLYGLSGRRLKIDNHDLPYTDGETIYLPQIVDLLATKSDNFKLFKAMLTLQWALTRYGTFQQATLSHIHDYPDPAKATALLFQLETIRLEACIQRELPGLYRNMQQIKQQLGERLYPDHWHEPVAILYKQQATAKNSLDLVEQLYQDNCPQPVSFQGELRLDAVHALMQARIGREKTLLRAKLAELANTVKSSEPHFTITQNKIASQNQLSEPGTIELSLNDKPITLPDSIRHLLSSIQLDLGAIPDDYLNPAGAGGYDPSRLLQTDDQSSNTSSQQEEGTELYDEWDVKRNHYRKHWCVLREQAVQAGDSQFARDTLIKYRGLVGSLRKTFEAMRDEDRLLKRQADGSAIDIDALVEAMADTQDGREMTDCLFTRMHRSERNIAVIFMIDMSGSTRGWVNDAERESLILLCEVLERLGDLYAIYGFSGNTRKKCDLYRIKTFAQDYNDDIKARIANIKPQEYTRMGVAIRHLSKCLSQQTARTRLLITLSDGKPDDIDHYRGDYGIEDTRKALIEAKHAGIHPFCITIDEHGPSYLAHMYGAVNYTLVSDVRHLPLKVANIYRKITS